MLKTNRIIFVIIISIFLFLNYEKDAFAEMSDIGIIGDTDSFVLSSISADGLVFVGQASDSGSYYAFRYDGSGMLNLGGLGGSSSIAYAASGDGSIIVGTSKDVSNRDRAFQYSDSGAIRSIATLGGNSSAAYGVSYDGSVIVGESKLSAGPNVHAFKFSNITSSVTDLGTLGGNNSRAYAVSGDGLVITGESAIAGQTQTHAFKYIDDGSPMADLGTLGGDYASGRAISEDGSVIVGRSRIAGNVEIHAFKYIDGSPMIDLGTLGGAESYASAVSADGSVIVGDSNVSSGDTHAFKYVGSTMIDLGTLGGNYSYASAVSADGSIIIGGSTTSAGENHVFVYRINAASLVDYNNTVSSLYYNGAQLNSLINLKGTLLNSNLNQDCSNFGANNLCLGADVRYVSVNKNSTQQQLGTLKVAYKFNPYFHAGIALNQSFNSNDPSNFTTFNSAPMATIFTDLVQNKDGYGLKLRISGSYNKSNMDIKRSVLFSNTEAGVGNSKLTSGGFLTQVSYKSKLANSLDIIPNVGIRYSKIARGGYSETSGASFPISYGSLEQKLTTAILGLNLKFDLKKNLTATAGGGVEHDLRSKIDGYSGNISNIGPFSLASPHIMNNRAFLNAGISYRIKDNQIISSSIYHGRQQLNNAYATLVYFGYVFEL